MPDLGKYAVEVLSAYGVSLALIVAIVWASISRAKKVKSQLAEIEKRREPNG